MKIEMFVFLVTPGEGSGTKGALLEKITPQVDRSSSRLFGKWNEEVAVHIRVSFVRFFVVTKKSRSCVGFAATTASFPIATATLFHKGGGATAGMRTAHMRTSIGGLKRKDSLRLSLLGAFATW